MMTRKAETDAPSAFVAEVLADTQKEPPVSRPKIYVADNSRFRPDAHEQRAFVEGFCSTYGVAPEWPSEHFLFPTGLTLSDRIEVGPPIDDPAACRGLAKSWRLIGNCEAIIADVSAFRGAHMNPLIAFEIGIAVVHAVPVFAWTADVVAGGAFLDLMQRFGGPEEGISPDGNWRDCDGNLIENFGLVEFAAIAGNFVSLFRSLEDAIAAAAHRLIMRAN
jgi:nucleoside 2-deoxyribosyltransferase